MHRLTYHDAGTALGLTYEQVRRRAQAGELEAAEPIDGKQSVSFRSVAALAAKIHRELPGPVDLSPFGELREQLTRFHVLGIERAAFLRRLEADAMEAEHQNDLAGAAVYWQLVAGLRETTYTWNPALGNWRALIPNVGTYETKPTVSAMAPQPVLDT